MELAHYRKLITLLVVAAITFAMQRIGLTPAHLAMFGISIGDMQEAVVDFLVTFGIPAVFMAAQPNGVGDTIWRWWHWIVGGLVIVAGLVLIVVGLGWIF